MSDDEDRAVTYYDSSYVVGALLSPTQGELQQPSWIDGEGFGTVVDVLSTSTGSVVLDAAIGGAVGYLTAPARRRLAYFIGGTALTGVGGLLGLVVLLAGTYVSRRR